MKGNFIALITDTMEEALQNVGPHNKTDFDTKTHIFNSLLLSGQIHEALRYITNQKNGGILQPDDTDEKTGRLVIETLPDKHPDLRQTNFHDSSCKSFEKYEECPDIIGLDITGDDVAEMALKLKGATGPTSVDAVTLSSWILCFGLASKELREEMAHWTEWLANTSPPWVAYKATMASCIIVMDKMPGIRPLGSGETYHRLWAKHVFKDC